MKPKLHVCLLAGALTLCLAKAAASPVTGTWVGEKDGVKAVTLAITESANSVKVNATFYIVKDEGSGKHTGAPGEMETAAANWNGKRLAFAITNTNGETVPFEMTVAQNGKAQLKRLAANGHPELTITLNRH